MNTNDDYKVLKIYVLFTQSIFWSRALHCTVACIDVFFSTPVDLQYFLAMIGPTILYQKNRRSQRRKFTIYIYICDIYIYKYMKYDWVICSSLIRKTSHVVLLDDISHWCQW